MPASAKAVWQRPQDSKTLAGIAADEKHVIVADRDFADLSDVFRCLSAKNGDLLWEHSYVAEGRLDYGNSPRATPLIHEGRVYLLGAFGHLHCLELAIGKIVWKKELPVAFGATLPTWGMTSSPLIVDGKLIVNPGGKFASLVALDPKTGKTVWQSPGRPAAYAAFITRTEGGTSQLIGYDETSLGGWDVKTGRRLWKLIPRESGDFNVPTPIAVGKQLLVTTENNGTRLYDFQNQELIPKPTAIHDGLTPDTTTLVTWKGRAFGTWNGILYALDLKKNLKEVWTAEDDAFGDYCSLIAGNGRVLITTLRGELLLVDAESDKYRLISRLNPFTERAEVYSHPAVVGTRLYIRGSKSVLCIELAGK